MNFIYSAKKYKLENRWLAIFHKATQLKPQSLSSIFNCVIQYKLEPLCGYVTILCRKSNAVIIPFGHTQQIQNLLNVLKYLFQH